MLLQSMTLPSCNSHEGQSREGRGLQQMAVSSYAHKGGGSGGWGGEGGGGSGVTGTVEQTGSACSCYR